MPVTSVDDAAWASPWRHRRVGEKVLLSLGLVLTALLAPTWPGTLLVALAALAVMLGPARIHPRVVLAVASAPLLFITISAVPIAVSIGSTRPLGTLLWSWGPFAVSHASLLTCARVFGHSMAGTLSVLLLAVTTPMIDLINWFRRLKVPDPLLEIAVLTYRMIFLVLEATLGVRQAQLNRLANAPGGGRGGLAHRFRSTGDAFGSIITRAWARGQRLDEGLAARGYQGALTTLELPRQRSWPLLGGAVCLLAGIWALALGVQALG